MFVVMDDFLNDEVQEFLGEFRVEISLKCQILEPRDLLFFARGVGWGKVVLRLEDANGLSMCESFGQREDKDRVQPVDAFAMLFQQLCCAGDGSISQLQSLSV